jgi:hypothetical protein
VLRKRVFSLISDNTSPRGQQWLDIERLAQVEITSEDAEHPIESAILPSAGGSWRAARPGAQALRLLFDEPLTIKQVHLLFREEEEARTQEFVLRWSGDGGRSYREIVRQQYNFSPPETTVEEENYEVNLDGVTVLELRIVPDISRKDARASLAQLRLA